MARNKTTRNKTTRTMNNTTRSKKTRRRGRMLISKLRPKAFREGRVSAVTSSFVDKRETSKNTVRAPSVPPKASVATIVTVVVTVEIILVNTCRFLR